MKKLAGTGASLSLGDVCHYRDGCPPHLRSQAELFLRWPIACHTVDALSQIHCSLPSDKVSKALNGHPWGSLPPTSDSLLPTSDLRPPTPPLADNRIVPYHARHERLCAPHHD